MSFTETDRTYVRRFVGMGSTFLSFWPLVESAITAVQSVADGGSRPDSSAENQVKGLIYGFAATGSTQGITPNGIAQPTSGVATPALRGLLQIEASIAFQDNLLGTMEAIGDAKLDAVRETMRLRREGRRMCRVLATTLGMRRPLKDVFSNSDEATVDDGSEESIFPDSRYW